MKSNIDHNEILYKIDWDVLNRYINNNLIIVNKHPEYDIFILNYSPKVQSKKLWDLYTLSCRGMIIDSEGNILARPLKKIRKLEDYVCYEIPMTDEFEVFEKLDGSLIILFYYEETKEWIISSRNSFVSEQVNEANKILNKSTLNHLKKDHTYIFEIIYPENKIVVDYGDRRELVLLSTNETKTGVEMYFDDLNGYYSKYFTIVNKLKIKSLKELNHLKEKNNENKEGVIIKYLNGFRVKFEFPEYTKLHSIVTNVSNIKIWENLKDGYNYNELIDKVPEKLYLWVQNVTKDLINQYNDMERISLKEFIRIYYVNNITTRKEFAQEAINSPMVHREILFNLYDKKDYSKIIWNLIKPKESKPYDDNHEIQY